MHHQVRKNSLPLILLAAFLTTITLMLLVRLPGMTSGEPESLTVEAENGIYDLTGADLKLDTITLLPGPTYYPNVLLTPESTESAVPVSTQQYDSLHADYLSQRFVVELPENSDIYTLTFTLSGRHAMRFYVNGELVGEGGKPGATKQDTEVWENNLTGYAAPKDGKMDILLQSAQFYHYRSGARLAALSVQNTASSPAKALPFKPKACW